MRVILLTIIACLLCSPCFAKECTALEKMLGRCDTEDVTPTEPTKPVFPMPPEDNETIPAPDPVPIAEGRVYYIQAIYMDKSGVPHNVWIGLTKDRKLCTEE